ncbi:hypothetical protein SEA_ARACELI_3 [Streptomyces phage Araceli]|nr:hypothetical protein SEA_ARACELI_3 [Streptomyces phage Araceli]
MSERYEVRKVHATALQKRLYPEAARRPFIVWDNELGRPVGLPDRYLSRSGAQARADRENEKGQRNDASDNGG